MYTLSFIVIRISWVENGLLFSVCFYLMPSQVACRGHINWANNTPLPAQTTMGPIRGRKSGKRKQQETSVVDSPSEDDSSESNRAGRKKSSTVDAAASALAGLQHIPQAPRGESLVHHHQGTGREVCYSER